MANFKEHGRLQRLGSVPLCVGRFFYGSNSSIQPVRKRELNWLKRW